MKRILEIKNFRNIGIEKNEELVINNSMEKGKLGNLIILVGANNSGKSNILDALKCFQSGQITNRDITTFKYDDIYRNPQLLLKTKNSDDYYCCSIDYNSKKFKCDYPNKDLSIKIDSPENNKHLCSIIIDISNHYRYYNISENVNKYFNFFSQEKFDDQEYYEQEQKLIQLLLEIYKDNSYQHVVNRINEQCPNNKLINYALDQNCKYEKELINKNFMSKYNVNFIPTIYTYTESNITNKHLMTHHSKINESKFFKTIFNAINIDIKEIDNIYNDFARLNNRASLTSYTNKINKKLRKISKDFNKLYYVDDDHYLFKINFESENIFFEMFRNDESITLDYQSTGFRWFFNLYFNLICNKQMLPGDIIIMDEPATNLHIMGQTELRKFLKDFTINNDITIILATHSPFLIDMDYLDELRVVSMQNNISSIENDFSTINPDDPDSLQPIKKALTVNNHVLYDPDIKIVFVEGITDYNYMVAFKKIFNIDDIVFLPVKGIGKYDSENFSNKQIDICKKLIEIKKHNPILMVDSDPAGCAMKELNKNDSVLSVFMLSDIDANFKEIECLFSKDDLVKFNIIDKNNKYNKHSHTSALFKTYLANKNDFSKTTIENFKKIFDYINTDL